MPFLDFASSGFGPVVTVKLLPSTRVLREEGQGYVPKPMTFDMLLDTGADASAIDMRQIPAEWRLYPRSFAMSQTLNAAKAVPIYELSITIVDPKGSFRWQVDGLRVSARDGSPFKGTPFHGVIGRDFLDSGMFIYCGPTRLCTLAY